MVQRHLPEILTWKAHAASFSLPSTAIQMTVVCPMVNLAPDCGLQVTETFPELSEATGSFHTTTAVGFPSSVLIDWLPLQLIWGSSVSLKRKHTNIDGLIYNK